MIDENGIEEEIIDVEDDDEDDFETPESSINSYNIPNSKDTFVDTKGGNIVERGNLKPFDMIKAIAKENGTIIKDPSPSCSYCYGRGYESIDAKTEMPLPCRCLFRGKTKTERDGENMYDANNKHKTISRLQKRRMKKLLLSNYKQQQKHVLKMIENEKNLIDVPEIEDNSDELLLVKNKYQELKSIKKTAKALGFTLTKTTKLLAVVSE